MNIRLMWSAVSVLLITSGSFAANYYVDPVVGSMSNPGSSASPWSTLSAVFSAGKTFSSGDHIYLRRGYHGVASITGINSGDVFIEAQSGHTPVVRMSMINANHWYFKKLTILGGVIIDNQTNENSDYNTFENCYLPTGGFQVYGNYTTLRGNHIRGGGIMFGYHSNNGLVSGNTLEDFYSDGLHNKGNYGVWENNLVMNSHKVDGNHNDLFQSMASVGNVVRGNELRAYSDPNQPDLVSPGLSDAQGIGLFDGWYTDWVIENNVIFVDHPIGIWIQGGKNCRIINNTVTRCGQNSYFSTRPPNIRVAAKKPGAPTGAPSIGNAVVNNIAERFELADVDNSGVSIGTNLSNSVVAKSAFASTFLNWGKKDMHLKTGASGVINSGTTSCSPPTSDADGNTRPNEGSWDRGAFEYGYVTSADTTAPSKPTGLTATVVTGYGVDLQWTASTDNRKVLGYDIYRNGVNVGRTRAGTWYLDITNNTSGSYTVKAFDHSDNFSVASDPAGGTPPAADTNAPSRPTNIVATAISSSAIALRWNASTDNVAVVGYDLYRGGSPIASVTGTNYTDSGLSTGTQYSYTLKAFDAAGNYSAASVAVVASTFSVDTQAPSVPSNVVATATSSSSIMITWKASTDNVAVAGYNVYRDGEIVDTTTTTNGAEYGLDASTFYQYTVAAFDAEGNESSASASASATTFDPANVMAAEPFSYAGGTNLNNLAGGEGWGGAWSVGYDADFPATVVAGNLGSYTGVGYSGNKLMFWTKGGGVTYQNLDRSFSTIVSDDGGTYWFAIMIAMCNSKNVATWHLAGLSPDTTFTNYANLFETTANGVPTPLKFGSSTLFTGSTNYTPHLILVKIVMSGSTNAETLTAYCDPNLSANPNTWTGVTRSNLYANNGIVGFAYRGGRASTSTPNVEFYMDEIRFAATWQDAVALTLQDTQAPSVPGSLSATAISQSAIALAWIASTDNVAVVGYDVYRNGTNIATVSGTGYTNTGLAAATTYSYTVKARDAATNVSAASTAANATTPDTQAPTVPANVTAMALSQSSIVVTWSPSTDNVGVTGYEVYRDAGYVTTVTGTGYTNTGLAAATTYSYTVKARDAATNISAASTAANATTPDTQAPTVPANVTAEAVSQSSIVVTWSPSTDNVGVTGYDIYRDAGYLTTVPATSYTNTGLSAATEYSYTVKARDAATNVSAASTAASATTFLALDTEAPTVPANVAATAQSGSSILVSWDASTDNVSVTGYEVYRGTTKVGSSSVTSYLDTGLTASTLYSYAIKAFDAATNVSAASASASATTLTPAAVLAEESFDYAATNLVGLNGGTGWSGDWAVESHYDWEAGAYAVVDGNLTNYPGMTVVGGHGWFLSGGSGTYYPSAQRNLATPIVDNGDTYWLAFLLQASGYHKESSYTLLGATNSPFVKLKADVAGMDFQFLGSAYYSPGDTNAHLFVIKMQMSGDANAETAQLYYDPDLSTDASTWVALRTNSFVITSTNGLTAFCAYSARSGNTGYRTRIDEIRLAGTWQAAVGLRAPDTEAPTEPANVMATAISQDAIALAWDASTDNIGVTGYDIYRDAGYLTTVSATSYTNTGLSAATEYSYTVKARDAATNVSAASTAANATTPDTEVPSMPSGLTATAISSSQIALMWTAASDNVGVVGYDVYRGAVLVASPVATSCTDTGLTVSTQYSYTVKARDAANNVSAASASAEATTFANPMLAEESFVYAATNLVGLNGGTGWSGGWTVESHYDWEAGAYAVVDGSLTNYPGMNIAGGVGSFLSGGGGTYYPSAQRTLTTPITDDGKTYWLGFILQAPAYHNNSAYTLAGMTNAAFVNLKTAVTGMDFQFLGGAYYSPGDTNAHLFLIKMQMSGDANPETAKLYYDPDLGTDPSTWIALRTNTFVITSTNGLTAFRTDSSRTGNTGYRTRIDEIRLGTSWQAAVGLPDTQAPVVLAETVDGMASEPGAPISYGSAKIRLSRTFSSGNDLTVNCAVGGSASNGVDYSLIDASATIPAGEWYTDVTITPVSDALTEGDEDVSVTLSSGAGYTVDAVKTNGTVTIEDAQ